MWFHFKTIKMNYCWWCSNKLLFKIFILRWYHTQLWHFTWTLPVVDFGTAASVRTEVICYGFMVIFTNNSSLKANTSCNCVGSDSCSFICEDYCKFNNTFLPYFVSVLVCSKLYLASDYCRSSQRPHKLHGVGRLPVQVGLQGGNELTLLLQRQVQIILLVLGDVLQHLID